jgi:hypothetical protein
MMQLENSEMATVSRLNHGVPFNRYKSTKRILQELIELGEISGLIITIIEGVWDLTEAIKDPQSRVA